MVGLGDGVDDGEAKTVALAVAVTIGRQFLEGVKGSLHLVVGDDRTAVGDRKGHLGTGVLGGDLYASLLVVVADGVVDEVGDEAFDQPWIPARHCGRQMFGQVDASVCCLVATGGQHSFDDLGEVEGVPTRDSTLAGGEDEECLDEPLLVFAEGKGLLAGRAQAVGVGMGVGEGDFEERAQAGETSTKPSSPRLRHHLRRRLKTSVSAQCWASSSLPKSGTSADSRCSAPPSRALAVSVERASMVFS